MKYVDQLGLLLAEKAELALREKALRALILPSDKLAETVTFAGDFYDVTIAPVSGRETLSIKRAKQFLTEALLAKITVPSKDTLRWNVKARS